MPSLQRQQQSNPKLMKNMTIIITTQSESKDSNTLSSEAIVDVKETSKDITNKVKSVTEQFHIIIDSREDELLDEIASKSASKMFALDSQFTITTTINVLS